MPFPPFWINCFIFCSDIFYYLGEVTPKFLMISDLWMPEIFHFSSNDILGIDNTDFQQWFYSWKFTRIYPLLLINEQLRSLDLLLPTPHWWHNVIFSSPPYLLQTWRQFFFSYLKLPISSHTHINWQWWQREILPHSTV